MNVGMMSSHATQTCTALGTRRTLTLLGSESRGAAVSSR